MLWKFMVHVFLTLVEIQSSTKVLAQLTSAVSFRKFYQLVSPI